MPTFFRTFAPQCGQAFALLDTSPPHSLQLLIAIL